MEKAFFLFDSCLHQAFFKKSAFSLRATLSMWESATQAHHPAALQSAVLAARVKIRYFLAPAASADISLGPDPNLLNNISTLILQRLRIKEALRYSDVFSDPASSSRWRYSGHSPSDRICVWSLLRSEHRAHQTRERLAYDGVAVH